MALTLLRLESSSSSSTLPNSIFPAFRHTSDVQLAELAANGGTDCAEREKCKDTATLEGLRQSRFRAVWGPGVQLSRADDRSQRCQPLTALPASLYYKVQAGPSK